MKDYKIVGVNILSNDMTLYISDVGQVSDIIIKNNRVLIYFREDESMGWGKKITDRPYSDCVIYREEMEDRG